VVEVAQPSIDVVGPRSGAGRVDALALVMHGGRERSQAAVTPRQLALQRMRPFARHLARAGGDHGLAVWTLQHRVRGWNGTERSPVADAEWALDEVTDRHGDVPVVLVGHSMGGRTAVHVAGHPRVVAVAALAPWLPRGEPVAQVAGRSVLVVHGRLDTTTSPRQSREWAIAASAVTDPVWWVGVRRERHAMLWRAGLWHRLATGYAIGALGFGPMPELLAGATSVEDRLDLEL
jgi:pimeloyl-ACP methyl ester carboxylesterase